MVLAAQARFAVLGALSFPKTAWILKPLGCFTAACNPLGRWGAGHTSDQLIFQPWAADRIPQLQRDMQEEGVVMGDGLTACCGKGLTDVRGCQPCKHEPNKRDARTAAHEFMRDKIIKDFHELYAR